MSGVKIRLFGLDAPETKQSCQREGEDGGYECGIASKEALQQRIGSNPVMCDIRSSRDR